MSPINVFIVEDQQLLRESLALVLSEDCRFKVVGCATNGYEAVSKVKTISPDVILMDIRMPIMDGIEATAQIKQIKPYINILLLTSFSDEQFVVKGLSVGAKGYLLKDVSMEEIKEAILLVSEGKTPLHPNIAGSLVNELFRVSSQEKPNSFQTKKLLTEREIEVLRLIAMGMSNREIAQLLHITEGTVKCHVSRILGKLDIKNRHRAALYAQEIGLIDQTKGIPSHWNTPF